MFIAMNRFKVNVDRAEEFERAWHEGNTDLGDVPGFRSFALLKSDNPGEYLSHSTWDSRDDFKAWTQSEGFHRAHARGLPEGLLTDRPQATFYEAVVEERGSR